VLGPRLWYRPGIRGTATAATDGGADRVHREAPPALTFCSGSSFPNINDVDLTLDYNCDEKFAQVLARYSTMQDIQSNIHHLIGTLLAMTCLCQSEYKNCTIII
jgi:hypothetical protein